MHGLPGCILVLSTLSPRRATFQDGVPAEINFMTPSIRNLWMAVDKPRHGFDDRDVWVCFSHDFGRDRKANSLIKVKWRIL